MSDKMITPDEYLIENPTHLVREYKKTMITVAESIEDDGAVSQERVNIDWTGYTEPHVMIGPDFPQSRKLEVKWGKWRITPDKVNKGDVPFQSVELPDGGTCFRIGKYIDEPSQELNSEPYRNPELRVDVIDTIGHIDYGDKADSLVWDYWYCQSDIIGWRPHFKEKN
jgi:hypothetical protein